MTMQCAGRRSRLFQDSTGHAMRRSPIETFSGFDRPLPHAAAWPCAWLVQAAQLPAAVAPAGDVAAAPPGGGVGYQNPLRRRGLTRCIGAAVPRVPDRQRRGVSGA
jgi:hypothetical protein